MFAAVWGSTMVIDGKVYLGDEDGDIVVLQAGKTKKVLAEMNMGSAVYATVGARERRGCSSTTATSCSRSPSMGSSRRDAPRAGRRAVPRRTAKGHGGGTKHKIR